VSEIQFFQLAFQGVPDEMSRDVIGPRKSPRQRRSQQTVDRIVEAAARVFNEVGYSSTTTNEIAAEAGVSIGSLYQYFPNKDSLLSEIAHRHISGSLAAFDELMNGLGPKAPVGQMIGHVIDLLVDQHEHDRLHLLIAHRAPRTAEIEQELERAQHHLVAVADRLLRDQMPERGDRPQTAQLLVAFLHAAIHDVILRHPPGVGRDAAVDSTKSAAIAITRA
jgi:AcrR family transcriptional regulator